MIELISQVFENIHFLVIHFSIALFPSSWLLDLIGLTYNSPSAKNGSLWCLFLGCIGSIFAICTGFMADNIYGHMTLPFPVFTTHGAIQIIASCIFWCLFFWRLQNNYDLPPGILRIYYVIIGGIGVGVLFYGSHLGAVLSGRV